jgi:RNA polymerase sigma-70 factor (sigma-E family)
VAISDGVVDVAGEAEAVPFVVVDHGFDAFVRDHGASLVRGAFLLTGDRQLAEDLVQTVLAKVSLRWSRIVAQGNPVPYVRVAIVRTAIGWRRRRWWGEVPSSPVPDQGGGDTAATVAGRDVLRRALLTLPPRQRAVVVLRFYEDLSEADTAAALGCSAGTVKSQTAKALARLRAVLGDGSPGTERGDEG